MELQKVNSFLRKYKKTIYCLIIASFFLLVPQFILWTDFSKSAYISENSQYIYIGNQQLELSFQKSDGELYGIKDKSKNIEFMAEKNVWWALYDLMYYEGDQMKFLGGWIANSFSYFKRELVDGIALQLKWDSFKYNNALLNISVSITIEVKDDSPLTYWSIDIINHESIVIEAIDFPALNGLGRISDDPNQDYLAYPSLSGLLFRNPLGNFIPGRGWGWEMYYPSAYSTMQFMAYYGLNPKSGLYISSCDSLGHSKYFNFSKPFSSWLQACIRHIPEFVPGTDYQTEYKIIVGIFSGDWYDAAQMYRVWALEQPWATQGTLWTRSDIPNWYRSAGLREWIYTHPNGLPNINLFSIVPEVTRDTSAYIGYPAVASWIGWERNGWYIEYPDVFPPKERWENFRQAVNNTHNSGNRVQFIPDTTSFSELAPSWSNASASACRDHSGNYINPVSYSESGRTTRLIPMCPATSLWQNTLDSMLSTLSKEGGDVIQLDGFPIFGPLPCRTGEHGHPIGGGSWWYSDYQNIFGNFKTKSRQSNPDLILTSEGMAEAYINLLESFWNPFTTGWSPNNHKGMLSDLSAIQLIPLWHVVYHDYAFLESGVSFISRQGPIGSVGYGDYRDYYIRGFALALIWGEMPTTWYNDEKISELNEQGEREIANYLRRIVEARNEYAQSYLKYGRMLKLPLINVPVFHINGAKRIPYSLEDYPPFDSPAVLSSVWKGPEGDAGYIFTNISPHGVSFELLISSSDLLLKQNNLYTIIQYKNGIESLLLFDDYLPRTFTCRIEPLDVIFIEVTTIDKISDKIILAPTNFSGQKVLNRSLSQVEYINVLNWQANPFNKNITKYRIYLIEEEHKSMLAELNSNKFEYRHRGVKKNIAYTYTVAAVNNVGKEGIAAEVTVQ